LRLPHLLHVAEGPERFAALLSAMSAAGLRAGWLELRRPEPGAPEPRPPAAPAPAGAPALPASLETAAALGVRRAVAAGGGRSLALKLLRGEPVLRDLVREHFLGCTLVLVRGDSGAAATAGAPETAGVSGIAGAGGFASLASLPALSPAGDGWQVSAPAGDAAPQHFDTTGLLDALRRPRPWGNVDLSRR
jgi:hypothetical protein